MLIPHIVRAQDLNRSNLKAIDVGTANTISLRRDSAQSSAPQPNGAAAARSRSGAEQCSATGRSGYPAASWRRQCLSHAASRRFGTGGSAIVSFDPPTLDQAVGATFTVNVNLAGGQNVYAVPLQVMYNPRVLQVLNVSNGPLLSKDGQTVALVNRDDSLAGHPAAHRLAAAGKRRHIRRWRGLYADLPGQGSGTGNPEHQPRHGKERRHAKCPASGSQAIVTVH